jgi:hypothetical protein
MTPTLTTIFAILRALIIHGCAEILRRAFEHFAPEIQPIVAVIISVVLGVVLFEFSAMYWHRHKKRE